MKTVMETNELPENVRAKIMDYAKACSYGGMYNPSSFEGAEFGYRLGLQSCEEQLKAKDEQVEKYLTEYWKGRQYQTSINNEELKQTIESLRKENEELRREVQHWKTSDGRGWKAVDRLTAGNEALRNQNDDIKDKLTRLRELLGRGKKWLAYTAHSDAQELLTEIEEALKQNP